MTPDGLPATLWHGHSCAPFPHTQARGTQGRSEKEHLAHGFAASPWGQVSKAGLILEPMGLTVTMQSSRGHPTLVARGLLGVSPAAVPTDPLVFLLISS